jgi:hypothetical protein
MYLPVCEGGGDANVGVMRMWPCECLSMRVHLCASLCECAYANAVLRFRCYYALRKTQPYYATVRGNIAIMSGTICCIHDYGVSVFGDLLLFRPMV